jgi:inner membrane protein
MGRRTKAVMAMDTVTQIALGAAVGEATLGRRIGNRAILWGGLCGLFPDLDVLIPFEDAVKAVTYHRGFSHSIFVLTALTPIFVWLILKLHPGTREYRTRWFVLVFLALITHVLLDGLTVYGTQMLWPLSTPPVMWSTLFIIDPAYSIPLIGGVLAAAVMSRNSGRGHRFNTFCLTLSTLYLAWSIGAKLYVDDTVKTALSRQNIEYQSILTVPTPFNTVLWRVLVMDDRGYYEGFYSLLDKNETIRFNHYASNAQLLDGLADHWPVQRLQWFTHGFYSVQQRDRAIIIKDLRMGLEPTYFFQFKVGEIGNPHSTPTASERIRVERGLERLRWVWKRIWDADAQP